MTSYCQEDRQVLSNDHDTSARASVERDQALFLVFLATGVDARGLELDADDAKRLLVQSRRASNQVRDDLVDRGGVPTTHDRKELATSDQLWLLVRAAKVCLVDDRLSMADGEYLLAGLDSPALRDILLAYADTKLTRHADPASSRVMWAIRVRTEEDVRDRWLTLAEASFLLHMSYNDREWAVRTIKAIPRADNSTREPVRIRHDGEQSMLPVPAALVEQIPSDATFDVEVSGEGVFFRRARG